MIYIFVVFLVIFCCFSCITPTFLLLLHHIYTFMDIFSLNHINIFIGGILLALSVVLLMLPIPQLHSWRKFRTGRGSLATAYLLLGLLMIVNGAMGADTSISSGMITLIIAYFQALLYTKTCVLFVKPRSLNDKRYHYLLIASGIYSSVLVACYLFSAVVFRWAFILGIVLYTALLIYCWRVFRTHYKEAVQHLEYVYDDDIHYSLQWVKRCFYSALVVGMMVWGMIVCYQSAVINVVGIVVYTIYYISMIGYFMRYVNNYNFVLRSDEQSAQERISTEATPDIPLAERLAQWTATYQYRDNEKTMEDIMRELHTNRRELNEYLTNAYGMNFRTWRNHLRIEDAKQLLRNTDIPVAELYHAVGYTDRSNFHRQFTELVGCKPSEYRMHSTYV